MNRFFTHASLLAFLIAAPALRAQEPTVHWIGTWAASPMGEHVNPGQPSPANTTYRDVVRISAGGASLRVQLTNEFGYRPLTIGAAHIALSAGAIQSATDHALTFSGQPSVIIPAEALIVSDPVPLEVDPLSSLAVSLYLPDQPIDDTTCHQDARATNFITPGNTTTAETLTDARTIFSWCFVKGIDISAHASNAAAIVTLGDSITDGARSTRDGNRLLHDGAGPNVLARFDRDVLAQSGVRYLIVLEGINDIGHIKDPRDASDIITAQDEIFALTQLVTRAHTHGIKVFGATLTPYVGAGYASPAGEQIREAVNQWIRTSGVFDGVIDFDQLTRDPANPTMFSPAVDSGDHLHPGDAGYDRMGSSIDLSLFH